VSEGDGSGDDVDGMVLGVCEESNLRVKLRREARSESRASQVEKSEKEEGPDASRTHSVEREHHDLVEEDTQLGSINLRSSHSRIAKDTPSLRRTVLKRLVERFGEKIDLTFRRFVGLVGPDALKVLEIERGSHRASVGGGPDDSRGERRGDEERKEGVGLVEGKEGG